MVLDMSRISWDWEDNIAKGIYEASDGTKYSLEVSLDEGGNTGMTHIVIAHASSDPAIVDGRIRKEVETVIREEVYDWPFCDIRLPPDMVSDVRFEWQVIV